MPKKRKQNKPQAPRAERIIDILLNGENIPQADADQIRAWLADGNNADEKREAFAKKVSETLEYDENPQYTPLMWPELAARLGIDPGIINNTRKVGMGVRMPLRRRIVIRAAAILIPLFVAVATLGLLVFDKADDITRSAVANIVTISVPAGQTRYITLADSSRVTLGGDSELIYDNNFTDGRSVKLSGEAKFEIKKVTDEQGAVPFTVSTNNLRVDVLGTVFKVTDREGSSNSTVALYEGSVDVGYGSTNTNLRHGDLFSYDYTTHNSAVSIISAREMLDNGFKPVLRFDRSSLSNLILAMESNHNVKFVVPANIDIESNAISANFEGVSLADVVKLLSITDRFYSYEITGDKIIITEKPDTYDD